MFGQPAGRGDDGTLAFFGLRLAFGASGFRAAQSYLSSSRFELQGGSSFAKGLFVALNVSEQRLAGGRCGFAIGFLPAKLPRFWAKPPVGFPQKGFRVWKTAPKVIANVGLRRLRISAVPACWTFTAFKACWTLEPALRSVGSRAAFGRTKRGGRILWGRRTSRVDHRSGQ